MRTRTQATRRSWRLRADQGSSAIELVLLTPALIALVFALIQTALVWNAQHTVGAAAQHGARIARTAVALAPAVTASTSTTTGTTSAGAAPTDSGQRVQQSTLRFLQQTGGRALTDPTVTVHRDGQYVTVTVSGTSIGVLPGTTVRVSGSSRSPVEGFRP